MAKKKRGGQLLDRLSVVLLAATGLVCLCYLVLLVLPVGLNPLARPTLAPIEILQLPTLPPTHTPRPPTLTPTSTPTPRFTNTPVITSTATPPGPTDTPYPTNTRPPTRTPTPTYGPSPTLTLTRSRFPFTSETILQVSPYGCNWAGIAGAVYDLEGKPASGYIVHVQGDADIDTTVNTGTSQFKSVPGFGESAWDVPINAAGMVEGTWRVRLYKTGSNQPVSDVYEVKLQAICGATFAFVKFVQNH